MEGSHLARYAARLRVVEVNSTFYRSHRPQTYQRWASTVPEEFHFALKMPKLITHVHRLMQTATLNRFLFEVSTLGSKLGPLLVQLPPNLAFDAKTVAMFFAESSLLAIGGIVIGLIIGGILVAYATKYGFYIGDYGATGILLGERLYAYLTPNDTLTLTSVAFIITLLASLYPAMLAARLDPVEALRGGK